MLAFSALRWLHTFIPASNPLDNEMCRNIMEYAKRSKSKPVTKKRPVSEDIIKQISDKYAGKNCSLKDLRTAAMCSIGFAGFLRFDEFSSILAKHLDFQRDHMAILIPRSKTDIYREGNIVYIKRIKGRYCPVELTKRYLDKAGIEPKSELPIFRRISFHRKSKSYSLCKIGLSYSRCLELFKECLEGLRYNPKEYGLHSLRSGGITSVVRNSNNKVLDRLLKIHGRWKCDISKDMYVHEDIQKRLEVTNFLGL